MKKYIIASICLVMIMAMATTVLAAGVGFSLAVSADTLEQGDTVTLTASVASSEDATAYGLKLEYDSAVFELVDGTTDVADTLVCSFKNGFAFLFQEPTTYTGTVGAATLKVKSTAQAGTYTISGTASVKNGNEVVSAEDCTVTVTVAGEPAPEAATDATQTEAAKPTQITLINPEATTEATAEPKMTEATTEATMAEEATEAEKEDPTEAPVIKAEPTPEKSQSLPAGKIAGIAAAIVGVLVIVVLVAKKIRI